MDLEVHRIETERFGEMIAFLAVCPNPNDVDLPPASAGDYQACNLLDEITAMQDAELEKLLLDFPSYEDTFLEPVDCTADGFDSLKTEDIFDKVLRYDCKWSGCDMECAKNHLTNICIDPQDLMCPNDMYSSQSVLLPVKEEIQPYTPDYDHCYYATSTKQTVVEPDDKLDLLKNIPTPPATSDSPSETSSEDEVDVVTVPEEYQAPVISRYDYLPRRSSRTPKRAKNSQRTQQSHLSARSLKAAMKRTRIQSIRRTYKRRKISNSVETTPASSMPSSAHSSRCNSDADEDIDKRRTHNSSERKRREAQRTALQNLRVVIPDLAHNPKAPKVLILNSATSLVKKLKLNKRTLKEMKHREMQKNKELLAKLNMLRMKLKLDR